RSSRSPLEASGSFEALQHFRAKRLALDLAAQQRACRVGIGDGAGKRLHQPRKDRFVLHLEALALREDLERRIERMTVETAQLKNLGAVRELDLPALAPHVHLPDVVTVGGDVDERGSQGVA